MSARPSFFARDLRLELLDPGEVTLVRLYKQARAGQPGGEWEPPPAAYRNLRVDPPGGHKDEFAVLYTSDTRKPHLQLSHEAARSGAWLAEDADWKTFEAENGGFNDVPKPGIDP